MVRHGWQSPWTSSNIDPRLNFKHIVFDGHHHVINECFKGIPFGVFRFGTSGCKVNGFIWNQNIWHMMLAFSDGCHWAAEAIRPTSVKSKASPKKRAVDDVPQEPNNVGMLSTCTLAEWNAENTSLEILLRSFMLPAYIFAYIINNLK